MTSHRPYGMAQVEGLNIPMSVGPPSVDTDNAGEECIVYDVIIDSKVRCANRIKSHLFVAAALFQLAHTNVQTAF